VGFGGILVARIVIVDDSKAFRSLLKSILIDAGHDVISEAENGKIGFEQCMRYQPDIVTLDIGMPIVDGITALKMIRAEFPAIKIIMISVASENDKVLETLELGASYYILKPCDAKYVTTVIDDILADSIKRRQPSFEV
jgi:two-component system chemotaxis response regulator CheY